MKKYILLLAVLTNATISFAQNSSSKNDLALEIENDTVKKKGQQIETVVISANQTKTPVSAARSGVKVMDLPQSVQVINSEVINQQQSIRLSEVIKNANGVYVGSARGGAQESFWSRGYDMGANNMFKNGFRFNSGSIPEVSSLEKVEFLKGSSALLYGNVAPGGILNLVTKTPQFTHGGEFTAQLGSYAYYKPTLDLYGPLNKSIAYRMIGSYENAESFRDVVKNERVYFNPSFLFNFSKKTNLTLQGDYLNADWIPDFGTGIIKKEILDIPRTAYFGALWSTGNTKSSSASALLNHDFNKNWKLSFNTSFQNYKRTQLSTAQMSNLETYPIRGDWKRGLTRNRNEEQVFGNQLSLQGIFKTGSIKHQIFTGADFENSLATAYTYVFYNEYLKTMATEFDPINLFNYDITTQTTVVPYDNRVSQIAKTEYNRFGVYFQDLVSITDKIKVLAGLRWSWQESQITTFKEVLTVVPGDTNSNILDKSVYEVDGKADPKRLDKAFSPKVGLILQPTKDITIFGSYANSFTPNTGNTYGNQPLEASIIDQYEAGIKTDLWKGFLSTNVTVYQINNDNLVQTAAFKEDGITPNNDANIKVMSGATKSQGVEIDITARPIDGFKINAGYSYNDMRYTKTSGKNGSFIEGDRVARTPQTTANLSFFYTVPTGFLKGASIGAIGNYIGNRIGGWNSQYSDNLIKYPTGIWDREIPLSDYTTVDVSAGYTWHKFSVLVKLSNITNELNYTVHENYSVNPIAPRQVLGSIKYKF